MIADHPDGRAAAASPYHAVMAQQDKPPPRPRAKRKTEALPRLHILMGAQNKLLGLLNEPAREHFRARGVERISIGFDRADPQQVVLRGDPDGRRIDPRGYVYATPLRGHVEAPADIVLRPKGAALTGRVAAGAETSQALSDAAALIADASECLDAAHGFLQAADHRVAADVAALIAPMRLRMEQAEADLVRTAREVRRRRPTATS